MPKTLRVPKGDWNKLHGALVRAGFVTRCIKNSVWSLEGQGTVITLYPSGVLVLDGRDTQDLYQKVLETITPMDEVEIGCDESGKGDVFGPLVVCCAAVRPESYLRVLEVAPKDSKKVSDEVLLKKAKVLKTLVDYRCKVVNPRELNVMYLHTPNLNRILDKLYSELLRELRKNYREAKIYVDAYSHVNPFGAYVNFEHRAEEYVSVSVASMIARSEFLGWLLERNLPKGSSKESMRLAKRICRESLERAKEVMKVFLCNPPT